MGIILGGLLFSGIGFIALRYGRSTGSTRAMVIGLLLMVYPYFVANVVILFLIGIVLVAVLFILHD